MPRVSLWFFMAAVIYAVIGMAWGLHMAISNDHLLYPAHAHLNLLGWVGMAIFGTFYALTRETYAPRLAWTQFAISNIGLVIMIVFLARLLASNDTSIEPLVGIGSILTMIGLLVFGWSVLRELRSRIR